MASGLTSLFAERMNQQVIGEVLRAIRLLRQLYEQFLATDDHTVVSLPGKNYCHVISHLLFNHESAFYGVFLGNSPSKRNCTLCPNRTREISCV